MNKLELQKTANEIRKGIVSGVHAAKAGHPGGSLSAADIFTYLYFVPLVPNNKTSCPKKTLSPIYKLKSPRIFTDDIISTFFPTYAPAHLNKLDLIRCPRESGINIKIHLIKYSFFVFNAFLTFILLNYLLVHYTNQSFVPRKI